MEGCEREGERFEAGDTRRVVASKLGTVHREDQLHHFLLRATLILDSTRNHNLPKNPNTTRPIGSIFFWENEADLCKGVLFGIGV